MQFLSGIIVFIQKKNWKNSTYQGERVTDSLWRASEIISNPVKQVQGVGGHKQRAP